ncbi:MAG TPA: hypothetical protein DCE41_18485 [Cytophagales bacterium]|nr:hypothetical protein [Cytophagales bacterium]HAA19485.1 hypothetical protein [Cytophagales bacterium]HAP59640.1 hypothetical protein [Cytophagales bacterium]
MIDVTYQVDHAEAIVAQLAQQLDYRIENHLATYENESLKTSIVALQPHRSLSCMVSEFKLVEHARVRRAKNSESNLIVLDFHVSKKADLSISSLEGPKNLIFGAFFASTNIGSYADFTDTEVHKEVAFIFDKQWVAETFRNHQAVNRFIESHQEFFIYQSIHLELATEIYQLHQYAMENGRHLVDEPYVFGQCLKALSMFFSSFSEEAIHLEYTANAQDIEKLMACRDYIHQHFAKPIKLEELARMSSMSESKFRKQFKAVFGKSPYDYIKHQKLWFAKELLEKGETASQAAYAIGYINLSHFTRSFKDLFGLTPSDHKKFHKEQRNIDGL